MKTVALSSFVKITDKWKLCKITLFTPSLVLYTHVNNGWHLFTHGDPIHPVATPFYLHPSTLVNRWSLKYNFYLIYLKIQITKRYMFSVIHRIKFFYPFPITNIGFKRNIHCKISNHICVWQQSYTVQYFHKFCDTSAKQFNIPFFSYASATIHFQYNWRLQRKNMIRTILLISLFQYYLMIKKMYFNLTWLKGRTTYSIQKYNLFEEN